MLGGLARPGIGRRHSAWPTGCSPPPRRSTTGCRSCTAATTGQR
ncbi:hypothetical protein NKG94_25065 [Micromonospora sp. M12]